MSVRKCALQTLEATSDFEPHPMILHHVWPAEFLAICCRYLQPQHLDLTMIGAQELLWTNDQFNFLIQPAPGRSDQRINRWRGTASLAHLESCQSPQSSLGSVWSDKLRSPLGQPDLWCFTTAQCSRFLSSHTKWNLGRQLRIDTRHLWACPAWRWFLVSRQLRHLWS